MPTGNPLEQLRRRMQTHATPTAFAALAEEHRRAGRLAEAVAVCREGLERYPAYASARVTLGRALLDSGDLAAAVVELEHAVAQAPDNLAAARALEAARTALGELPAEPPPLPAAQEAAALSPSDLPLRDDLVDAGSSDLIVRALGSGPDGPQEFGLSPDWSLPDVVGPVGSSATWLEEARPATEAVLESQVEATYAHDAAPTTYFEPPHLQGDEPAGVWALPASEPPSGGDGFEEKPGEELIAEPAGIWSMPGVDPSDVNDAPGEDALYSWEPDPSGALGLEPTPTESPDMWGAPLADPPVAEFTDVESPVSIEAAAASAAEVEVSSGESAPVGEAAVSAWESAAMATQETESEDAPLIGTLPVPEETAAAATMETADPAAEAVDPSSPFWTGLFGGEPAVEATVPFTGWGDDAPPVAEGADPALWAEDAVAEPAEAWTVPDGPSSTWALGDLHEAAGADATPFQGALDDSEGTTPVPFARMAETVEPPAATHALPQLAAWEGSVKSALGEVFALAGSGESLEPPPPASPAVRDAMANAAVEAALEDAVMNDDGMSPALASLEQMLAAVRARRAALAGSPRS